MDFNVVKKDTEALVPTLDEETTQQIIKDAENARLFAKALDSGEFRIGEDLVKVVVGRVTEVDRYGGKFENKGMTKIRNFIDEGDLPEGYELRADVTITTPEGMSVTVSLPPSSYKYHFANQVKRLNRIGRDITDCLVEFSVKVVKNKDGKVFPVVVTKVAEPMTPRPIKQDLISKALDHDILDKDIPF
jgi:hypothetical protein